MCDFGFLEYMNNAEGTPTFRQTVQLPSWACVFGSSYTDLALGSVSKVKPWLDEQRSGMLTNMECPCG
jgi:hypothetical protein